MNIYLIRHGEKTDDQRNHESLELTEKGFMQADLLGKRIRNYGIRKIYSSNMTRAIQTAEAINRYTDVDIAVRPGLREVHMGACEIEGWAYMESHYPEFMEEFYKHEADIPYPPNGECGADVWKRSSVVLDEITGSGYDNVAVVAHGGTIRVMICGMLLLAQEKRFSFGSPLQNCSISLVKYNEKKKNFCLQTFNDYAHLEVRS